MTATAADFLREIIAHPEEDAPRLIYADWLEERGQPGDGERGEFIRIQCELAVASQTFLSFGCVDAGCGLSLDVQTQTYEVVHHPDCRWQKLYDREAELLKLAGGWAAGIPEMVWHSRTFTCKWRRGFITEMQCDAFLWMHGAWQCLYCHPVEKLTVSGIRAAFEVEQIEARVRGSSVRELQLTMTADFQMLSPEAIQDSLSHRLPGVRVTVRQKEPRLPWWSNREVTMTDIARAFGLPPHMVNGDPHDPPSVGST